MTDLPHLAARLFARPLLVSRAKLDVILPILVPRLLGQVPRLEQPGEPRQPAAPAVPVPAQIAVVPVFGTLIARGAGVIAMSGETSYEALSAVIGRLAANPEVGGILLDIDSCGGEYAGLPEFAAELAAAGRQKPIWAIVRPACFSAAYWIASQAERILVTPSCELGSIGVMAVHVDVSASDAQQGYKLTFFNAGDRKLDGNPHLPINEAFARDVQAGVERAYGEFVAAVARGRGQRFGEKAIRATEARTYEADAAVKLGMADQVATFNETIRAFAERLAKGSTPMPAASVASQTSTTQRNKESAMTDPVKPGTEAAPATTAALPAQQPADLPTNVVDLNAARAEGEARAIAYVQEMTNLCTLAGAPEKAAAFIAAKTSVADASKALLAARAAESDATAIVATPAAGTPGKRPAAAIDTQAIYAQRAKQEGRS